MENLIISTVQFENKSGDKEYNIAIIDRFAGISAARGSSVVAFHECSVTGYTFARRLDYTQMLNLAELIPEGPSTSRMIQIATNHHITLLAGLFEKDREGKIFKTYLCVDEKGFVAKHRKLHPFINQYITPGDAYTVFDLHGWKAGILICYDNNIIENVRATTLLGAQLIFMPHVTMCTPAPRPGSGFIDPELWLRKNENPELLRKEFNGPKGREWLMKWLPARAHDNGIYIVFSNPVGMDDDQLKNGCSMIIDPFGDIIAECMELGDDSVNAILDPAKLTMAGGHRYTLARRPELYREIIGKDHTPVQKIAWINKE